MLNFSNHGLLVGLIILIGLARPAVAFGAGNIASISKIEGQNWRHGDIEDALLTLAMARAMRGGKNFDKISVSRVYFGNWLRDYSQAIDVGTVKMISAEAIRLLLCILGFMTFGYGSGEFEVTAERLGCYRPEDHIDNPKDYAENMDARQYDRRLRAPVDERTELGIDPETGMKNYIANERAGIMTSARHIKQLFGKCIELGRRYKRSGNKDDLYESLRLMGTGLHCLEDYYAHSNYCELALIEMGERDVFPHCGQNTQIRLEGARQSVYPVVTGTFGGVDFLHSITGEVSDKLTQNEIDELEGTLKESQNGDTSMLRDLLDKIPDGIFDNKKQAQEVNEIQNNANSSHMQNMSVSPRDPEEFTAYVKQLFTQIMPVIKYHDDIMKKITSAVEKIPVLPKILEQLEEQLSVFVFSIIAQFIVPLIHQIRNELKTGAEEIIQSSEKEQHVVFHDDNCSDPTHSMLAKDHFSNILNEVAGQAAAKMLHWVVPQLMDAIDEDSTDVDRVLNRIVDGVLHHPAQRGMGRDGVSEARQSLFQSVEEWWREMGDGQRQDYRRKLSRNGVLKGENHKEGVYDTGHGHGCSGKLKMKKLYAPADTVEDKIATAAASAIIAGATGAISGMMEQNTGYKMPASQQKKGSDDIVGDMITAAAGSLLGGAFDDKDKKKEVTQRRNDDGSYTRTETEYGRQGDRYGQAQFTETRRPDGGRESEYQRYEQKDTHGGREATGYGYEERTETRRTQGGGYEQRTERHEYSGSTQDSSYSGGYGGGNQSSDRQEQPSYGGGRQSSGRQEQSSYGGGHQSSGRQEQSSYGGGYSEGQKKKKSDHDRRKGNRSDDDDDDDDDDSDDSRKGYKKDKKDKKDKDKYQKSSDSYGGRSDSRERRKESSHGGRSDSRERRNESSYGGSSGGYGGNSGQDRREDSGYGRSSGGGSGGGYGGSSGGYGSQERREESYGGSSGGYGSQQRREESYGDSSSGYGSQQRREESYGGSSGGYGSQGRREEGYGGNSGGEAASYGGQGRREEGGYGQGRRGDDDNDRRGGDEYGRRNEGGYGGSYGGGY